MIFVIAMRLAPEVIVYIVSKRFLP
jgi:hypothetical protein